MNLFTIDEYYDILFYNECLNALKNNNVVFKEYINLRPPYNWYIATESLPILVNYDLLDKTQEKFLVNKVEPTLASEEYLLLRKMSNAGKKAINFYVLNEPLQFAENSNYACFFNLRSKEQALELSRSLGKIYYFGKYYNNKFRVALCFNNMIKNFISPEDILVEKETSATQMELDLNWKVFKLKDKLRKFTNTPYFDNGVFKTVKIQQFNFNL